MFNLQGSEIIVILLLALVVLGPEKLPDAIRKFSQTYAELKKMGTGFQSELKSVLDEPMQEMRDTAALLQDAADPAKIAERAEKEAEDQAAADKAAAAERAAKSASKDSDKNSDSESRSSTATGDDGADDRPAGVSNPGSDTVAVDDSAAEPINQIAAANARSKIEPDVSSELDRPSEVVRPDASDVSVETSDVVDTGNLAEAATVAPDDTEDANV